MKYQQLDSIQEETKGKSAHEMSCLLLYPPENVGLSTRKKRRVFLVGILGNKKLHSAGKPAD